MAEKLSQDFRYEMRRIMRGLAREALSQADRLFDPNDIEPVHQMRVSINKLRVALANFGAVAPKQDDSKLREDLRWIKDSLGAVRDGDVMLERLRALTAQGCEEHRQGLDVALKGIERERAAALGNLRAETARKRYRRLKERLAAFAKGIQRNGAPRHVQDLRLSERLDVQAARIIQSLYRRVEKDRLRLIDSFAPEVMHRLRISAKRLRYVLSFFRDQRPDLYNPLQATLSELHDCVGALHDIDVLGPKIEAIFARQFMTEGRDVGGQAEPGVDWLLHGLHDTRRDLMRQFYRLWDELASERFADRCRQASTPPRPPISVVPRAPNHPEATMAQ